MNIVGQAKDGHAKTATVVSVLPDRKTAKVHVEHVVKNGLYGKRFKRQFSLLIDVAGLTVKENDLVLISPSRRLSKNKSWKAVGLVNN